MTASTTIAPNPTTLQRFSQSLSSVVALLQEQQVTVEAQAGLVTRAQGGVVSALRAMQFDSEAASVKQAEADVRAAVYRLTVAQERLNTLRAVERILTRDVNLAADAEATAATLSEFVDAITT